VFKIFNKNIVKTLYLQFTDVGKVSERGLLGADTIHLRWLHHELPLLARDHVGILLPHDVEHSIEQLVVGVVTLAALPVAATVCVRDRFLLILFVRIGLTVLELD
jgi:hypothetical protein